MYFTNEWSDWRNGMFFWLQAAYGASDDVIDCMLKTLDEFQKERGCCGYRLCSEMANSDYWKQFIDKMNLTSSHYYIYHIDTYPPFCSEDCEQMPIYDMDEEIFEIKGKHLLMFDKTNGQQAMNYFKYHAHMFDMEKQHLDLLMNKTNKDELFELLRSGIAATMRIGMPMVIYLGKMLPDFEEEYNSTDDIWPSQKIFNYLEWTKKENYFKVLREWEMIDQWGNKNTYKRLEKFRFIILAEYESDEKSQEVVDRIPFAGQFA